MKSASNLKKEDIIARWPDVVEEFEDLSGAYEAMSDNVAAHRVSSANYYKWIAAVLAPYLSGRTMELGAGPGFLSQHLPPFDFYLATETYEPFLAELKTLSESRKDMEVCSLDVADLPAQRDKLRGHNLDSIFSTNMLEHVKDDIDTLRDMASVVRPGGRVVNMVPALRYLYGKADSSVGHLRRYEKDELRAKMEAGGLMVEKIFYFNLPGVLAWFIVNKILGRENTTGGQFRLFNIVVPFFRMFEKVFPAITGSSLIGVGSTPFSQKAN